MHIMHSRLCNRSSNSKPGCLLSYYEGYEQPGVVQASHPIDVKRCSLSVIFPFYYEGALPVAIAKAAPVEPAELPTYPGRGLPATAPMIEGLTMATGKA